MKTNNYIAIEQLCEYYDVPVTFINTLNDFNFIEIATIKNINYVIHCKQYYRILFFPAH